MEDMTNNEETNGGVKTMKTALRLPTDVLHRLKCAVIHAQRQDPSITLTGVVVRGVELVMRELEKKYGEAPDTKSKLRTGRRLRA
jgi:hypothetical protein